MDLTWAYYSFYTVFKMYDYSYAACSGVQPQIRELCWFCWFGWFTILEPQTKAVQESK